MKKLMVLLGLSFLSLNVAFADYKLILTSEDGNQNEECIKSYSFYNNLESIARQNGLGKDIYSEEEVMTNKIWMGKPVYRKVLPLEDFIVPYGVAIHKHSSSIANIDSVIRNDFRADVNGDVFTPSSTKYVIYTSGKSQVILVGFDSSKNQVRLTLKQNHGNYKKDWHVKNFKFIIEYTKTTDKANISTEKFKSYLHYVTSGAKDGEFISIDLKNVGVQILENYTYDTQTNSCIKN